MQRLFPLNLYAIKAPKNLSTEAEINKIIFRYVADDNTFEFLGRITKDDIFFDCYQYVAGSDYIAQRCIYEEKFREILCANDLYWVNPVKEPDNATLSSIGVPMYEYLSNIALAEQINELWKEKELQKLCDSDILLIIAPVNED